MSVRQYSTQIPSFFETLESPAVEEYKRQQELALAAAVAGKSAEKPALAAVSNTSDHSSEGDDEEFDDVEEMTDIVTEMQSKVSFANGAGPPKRANRECCIGYHFHFSSSTGPFTKLANFDAYPN